MTNKKLPLYAGMKNVNTSYFLGVLEYVDVTPSGRKKIKKPEIEIENLDGLRTLPPDMKKRVTYQRPDGVALNGYVFRRLSAAEQTLAKKHLGV